MLSKGKFERKEKEMKSADSEDGDAVKCREETD